MHMLARLAVTAPDGMAVSYMSLLDDSGVAISPTNCDMWHLQPVKQQCQLQRQNPASLAEQLQPVPLLRDEYQPKGPSTIVPY